MEKDPDISSELLARYVAGEATPEERAQVQAWAEGPQQAAELERWRALWELSAEGAMPEVDVDAAWARMEGRMDGERGRVVPIRGRARAVRWVAAAAAVVALVVSVQVLRMSSDHSGRWMAEVTSTTGMMPDSSRFVLAPGSSLRADFDRTRQVQLEGRAYFEVQRDPARPFVIAADAMTVTVLGTAFEVAAYDTSGTITVRVRHGRVRVEVGAHRLELVGGEQAAFDKLTKELLRAPNMALEQWGDRILQFEQAPLAQVVERLERIHGIHITLANEAIARCSLTATFEDEPLEEVLRVVAVTFGLQVEKVAPDRYLLTGDGC